MHTLCLANRVQINLMTTTSTVDKKKFKRTFRVLVLRHVSVQREPSGLQKVKVLCGKQYWLLGLHKPAKDCAQDSFYQFSPRCATSSPHVLLRLPPHPLLEESHHSDDTNRSITYCANTIKNHLQFPSHFAAAPLQ